MNPLFQSDVIVKNITFTPAEWAEFAGQINAELLQIAVVALVIGFLVGIISYHAGEWYIYRRRR